MNAQRRALAQQVGELLRRVRRFVGGASETEVVLTAPQIAAALQTVDHQINRRRVRVRFLLPPFHLGGHFAHYGWYIAPAAEARRLRQCVRQLRPDAGSRRFRLAAVNEGKSSAS